MAEQCQARVVKSWGDYRCRLYVKENGLCFAHLRAGYATKTAQAAYVAAWRGANPYTVYGETWTCPLCNTVVQTHSWFDDLEKLTTLHQRDHGADWTSYEQAGKEST